MPKLSERGIIHLLIPLILLILGLIVGVYLVTSGNPLKFFSKASNAPIVLKDLGGNVLSQQDGIFQSYSSSIKVELTSTLGATAAGAVKGVTSNAITCNQVTLQASPNPVTANKTINFTISGDASTYIGDNFGSGAVNCHGPWNNISCTASAQPGAYTWNHTWKHCVGDFNHCSDTCSVSLKYQIASASSSPSPLPTPTPKPTSSSTPTTTPSPAAVYTVAYKIAENPNDLTSAPEIPYLSEPTVLTYTFRDTSLGKKFIWVEFIASNSQTDRRTVQVNLICRPRPACLDSRPACTIPEPADGWCPSGDNFVKSNLEIGLEAGEQNDTSRVDLVAESRARWVRLNFIGGDWATGSATTATYNRIIDAYQAKNTKIIGLIGAQSVSGGYDRENPGNFTQKFTDVADAIVNQFGNRVKNYELFNEPNDWGGGQSSQVTERYFAEYLASVYRRIKIDRKKSDISLNSGPLFSFDLNNGAQYLEETYNQGKTLSGPLNWETIKSLTGSYPLDGVGYHLYVAQGMDDQAQVESQLRVNLDAIESVISSLDPDKKIWITEMGWGTGSGRVTEAVQAANLEKAYKVLYNDSMVRLGMWFTLQDFDTSEWGLIRGDGVKKLAWQSFQNLNSPHATSSSSLAPASSSALSACSACAVDTNKDKLVNIQDFSFLVSCFGKKSRESNILSQSCNIADVNGDEKIDSADLSCLRSQFGKQCVTK